LIKCTVLTLDRQSKVKDAALVAAIVNKAKEAPPGLVKTEGLTYLPYSEVKKIDKVTNVKFKIIANKSTVGRSAFVFKAKSKEDCLTWHSMVTAHHEKAKK